MDLFISQFKGYLQKNEDQVRAEKEKAYLYSDFTHYGISMWQRRDFLKLHKKYLLSLNKQEIIKLVKYLWNQPSFEEKDMALEILQLKPDLLDISDMPMIEKMMSQSKGWALLDNLIIPIMPIILAKNNKAYNYLIKWIKSDDYWVRRSALLAQLLFFRRDNGGNRNLFFKLATSQFDEKWIDEKYKNKLDNKRAKFFIRKAIGGTLREMSTKQPEIVFQFVKNNKTKMSGLSIRQATRKLPKHFTKRLNM